MRTSLTLLCLMTFVLGFALIGDALAQSDDPSSAASDAGAPVASGLTKPDVAPTAEVEAEAPSAEEAEPKPIDQAKGVYENVKGGHWLLAFGFFGMLLGSIARFAVGKKWDFIKSKAGGYAIAGLTGLGILGGLIIESGTFSIGMIPTAVTGMLAAMALHGPAKAAKKKLVGSS